MASRGEVCTEREIVNTSTKTSASSILLFTNSEISTFGSSESIATFILYVKSGLPVIVMEENIFLTLNPDFVMEEKFFLTISFIITIVGATFDPVH